MLKYPHRMQISYKSPSSLHRIGVFLKNFKRGKRGTTRGMLRIASSTRKLNELGQVLKLVKFTCQRARKSLGRVYAVGYVIRHKLSVQMQEAGNCW